MMTFAAAGPRSPRSGRAPRAPARCEGSRIQRPRSSARVCAMRREDQARRARCARARAPRGAPAAQAPRQIRPRACAALGSAGVAARRASQACTSVPMCRCVSPDPAEFRGLEGEVRDRQVRRAAPPAPRPPGATRGSGAGTCCRSSRPPRWRRRRAAPASRSAARAPATACRADCAGAGLTRALGIERRARRRATASRGRAWRRRTSGAYVRWHRAAACSSLR